MRTSECVCPPGHSVTKLGHNRDCDGLNPNPPLVTFQSDAHRELVRSAIERGVITVCGSDRCRDGAPHDYSWATYSDEELETGVCRCGLREIDMMLLRGHP